MSEPPALLRMTEVARAWFKNRRRDGGFAAMSDQSAGSEAIAAMLAQSRDPTPGVCLDLIVCDDLVADDEGAHVTRDLVVFRDDPPQGDLVPYGSPRHDPVWVPLLGSGHGLGSTR